MTIVYFKSNDEFKYVDINIWSGNLQKDESVIWSHIEQRGFLQKHFWKTYAIMNFRIFIYDRRLKR